MKFLITFLCYCSLSLTFDSISSKCITACPPLPPRQLGQSTDDTSAENEELLEEILNTTQYLVQQVNSLANTLSAVKNMTAATQETLATYHNDHTPISPQLSTSCKEIKEKYPNSPSGTYLLVNGNNPRYLHCHMGELCGSSEGWTRLAYKDMSDPSEECPYGFKLHKSGHVRACGRAASAYGSCTSVLFPSYDNKYSQICGRIHGYQYSSTDAIDAGIRFRTSQQRNDINSFYLDGISLTHGFPRNHIWSFIAGNFETGDNPLYSCPCDQTKLNAFNI